MYGSASNTTLSRLDVFQNECLRKCLGALRCTRTARLEVEANVPPLRIRREHLVLSYGMNTIRKTSIGNVACGPLVRYEPEFRAPRRPLAMRLHSLCQELGVDLADGDKLVTLNIAPWEIPNIHIYCDLLLTP